MENFAENAITKVTEATNAKMNWKVFPIHGKIQPDFQLDMELNGQKATFIVECKRDLRTATIPKLVEMKKEFPNLMVITKDYYPNIADTLFKQGIAYMDGTGGAYIKAAGIYIMKEGKTQTDLTKNNKRFTPIAVKLIFNLLNDDKFIDLKYREIAKICDTALGNVTKIFDDLAAKGYILKQNKNKKKLQNKKELFDNWIEDYETELKPKLLIGKFRFINAEGFGAWEKLRLPKNTYWGGEPAAQLITHYLQAAKLTLYTGMEKIDLIKKYRFIPDTEKGYLEVYRNFWKQQENHWETAPYILIYADLINTKDPRNIETAQMIYDRHIKEKL